MSELRVNTTVAAQSHEMQAMPLGLFHRVQRVDKKDGDLFDGFNTPDFETRRLNFTFRYVPREHIQPLSRFPLELQQDVRPYVEELSKHSAFFADTLSALSTR